MQFMLSVVHDFYHMTLC